MPFTSADEAWAAEAFNVEAIDDLDGMADRYHVEPYDPTPSDVEAFVRWEREMAQERLWPDDEVLDAMADEASACDRLVRGCLV